MKDTVARGVSLFTGCLLQIAAGTINFVPVYANALKKFFHLTQNEFEVLSSIYLLGAGLLLVNGCIYDRWGPRIACMIGTILTCFGCTLILTAFYYPAWYSAQSWLIVIFFFIMGHGSTYFYIASYSANIVNFLPEYRGKVMMVLDSSFFGAVLIYGPVYYALFRNGHIYDEEKQDIKGYFILILTTFLVAGVLGIIFVKNMDVSLSGTLKKTESTRLLEMAPADAGETKSKPEADQSINGEVPAKLKEDTSPKCLWCPTCIRTWIDSSEEFVTEFFSTDYQFIFWIGVLVGGPGYTVMNNPTVISASLKLSSYDFDFVIYPSLIGVLSHFVIGPLSDKLGAITGKMGILLVTNTLGLIGLGLLATLVTPASLLAGFSLVFISNVGIYTILPIVISERYIPTNIGKLWGVNVMAQTFLILALQSIFGSLYDIMATSQSNSFSTCYGISCYFTSIVLLCALYTVAIIVNVAYICWLRLANRKDTES